MTSSDSASNQDSTAPEATEPDTGAPAFDPPDPMLRAGIGDDHEAIFDPQADVIIGVSFDNVIKAQEYLLAMGRLRQSGALELHDAVTVTKGDDGKVNVTETIDPTPGARRCRAGCGWVCSASWSAGPSAGSQGSDWAPEPAPWPRR